MKVPIQRHVNCEDPKCQVCLEDSQPLSDYLDEITGATTVDHLGRYHKWLSDKGIEPETEWGWWTEAVFKPENMKAYARETRGESTEEATMTTDQVSRILHEGMGLEWKELNAEGWFGMEGANGYKYKTRNNPNPDYSTHPDYWTALMWAVKQPWWEEFALTEKYGYGAFVKKVLLDPKVGSHALAGFLEGKLKEEEDV